MADSTTKTVGVDLAKQVFAICETNHSGHVIRRLELRRDAFCHYLSQLPAASVVAMEACSRQQTCAPAVGDVATRRGLRQRGLAAASDGAAVTQKSHRRLSFKPFHRSGFNAGSDTGNKRSDRFDASLTNKLAP